MAITLHGLPDNHESVVNAAMRLRRPYSVAAVAVGVVGLLGALVTPWGPSGGARIRWFGLVLVAVFLVLSPLLVRTLLQWRMKDLPDESWIVTINEERVSRTSVSAGAEYPWSAIGSVTETPESFILRQGWVILAVLPKNEFHGDDLDQFRRLVGSLGKA